MPSRGLRACQHDGRTPHPGKCILARTQSTLPVMQAAPLFSLLPWLLPSQGPNPCVVGCCHSMKPLTQRCYCRLHLLQPRPLALHPCQTCLSYSLPYLKAVNLTQVLGRSLVAPLSAAPAQHPSAQPGGVPHHQHSTDLHLSPTQQPTEWPTRVSLHLYCFPRHLYCRPRYCLLQQDPAAEPEGHCWTAHVVHFLAPWGQAPDRLSLALSPPHLAPPPQHLCDLDDVVDDCSLAVCIWRWHPAVCAGAQAQR